MVEDLLAQVEKASEVLEGVDVAAYNYLGVLNKW